MRRRGLRGLLGWPRRLRTTDSRHGFPVAADLLKSGFTADRPNQAWLTDFTCVPTEEGCLYPAAVMDQHTRHVLNPAMRDHLRAELLTVALVIALGQQKPSPGLVQHPDRKVQHACTEKGAMLASSGTRPSTSRRGNATMESFSHTPRTEPVHHRTDATRDKPGRDLFAYVEG